MLGVKFEREAFHDIICPATSFTFSKANDASTDDAHDTRPARNNSTGTYLITLFFNQQNKLATVQCY